MSSLFALVAELFGADRAQERDEVDYCEMGGEPLEEAHGIAEEESFIDHYDMYASRFTGSPVKSRSDLYINMMVSPGRWAYDGPQFYWVPTDHPLNLPLRNAWARRGGVADRVLSAKRMGACAVYAEQFVHAAASGVCGLYARHGRPLEGEEEEEEEEEGAAE